MPRSLQNVNLGVSVLFTPVEVERWKPKSLYWYCIGDAGEVDKADRRL